MLFFDKWGEFYGENNRNSSLNIYFTISVSVGKLTEINNNKNVAKLCRSINHVDHFFKSYFHILTKHGVEWVVIISRTRIKCEYLLIDYLLKNIFWRPKEKSKSCKVGNKIQVYLHLSAAKPWTNLKYPLLCLLQKI